MGLSGAVPAAALVALAVGVLPRLALAGVGGEVAAVEILRQQPAVGAGTCQCFDRIGDGSFVGERAADAVETFIASGIGEVMNVYNRKDDRKEVAE